MTDTGSDDLGSPQRPGIECLKALADLAALIEPVFLSPFLLCELMLRCLKKSGMALRHPISQLHWMHRLKEPA